MWCLHSFYESIYSSYCACDFSQLCCWCSLICEHGDQSALSMPTDVAELISIICAVYPGAALQSDMPIKARAGVSAGSKQGTYTRRIHQGIYDKESLL